MKDKIFIDTNILVYIHLMDNESAEKRVRLRNLLHTLNADFIISVQVINEFYNVLLRKKIKDSIIQEKIRLQMEICSVSGITIQTIFKAWDIRGKYKYSYWDSLIIAAAIENSCTVILSEDMQHEQLIEKKMQIINPFHKNFAVQENSNSKVKQKKI